MEDTEELSTAQSTEQQATTTPSWRTSELKAKKEGERRCIYQIRRSRPSYEQSILQHKHKQNSAAPTQKWEIAGTYTGEWSDDLRHGYGVQIWPSGSKYEGDWKNNRRTGYGVFWQLNTARAKNSANCHTIKKREALHEKQDVELMSTLDAKQLAAYQCLSVKKLLQTQHNLKKQLNKPRRQSAKTEESCHQRMYEGEWQSDLRHGKGTTFHQSGDRFEGNFQYDLKHGYGVMYYKNGDTFEGDWKYDKRTGFGRETKKNGNGVDIFEGYWMNNLKEGPGYYKYANKKQLYVAEWVNDTPRSGFFVEHGQLEQSKSTHPNKKPLLPILGLIDADQVLAKQIEDIRVGREAVRSMANINSLQELFKDNISLQQKIIEIFEQNCVAIKSNNAISRVENSDSGDIILTENSNFAQYWCPKSDLFHSMKNFDFYFDQHLNDQQLNTDMNQFCHELGLKLTHKKCDTAQPERVVLTLLDFGKMIQLFTLLHKHK